MSQLRFVLLLAVAVAASVLTSCGDSGDKPASPRTYSLGEKVTLGHIVYQVFETQWLTHMGQGVDARVPQHRFFLVRLSATNGGGGDVTVPNFSMEDDHGNSYPELSAGEGVPQYIGFLRMVKPADSVQGNAIFDAPPQHYKMKIADETGEIAAYIDIPLSFVAETPEIPNVGAKDPKK
jgi:hypothetical protein